MARSRILICLMAIFLVSIFDITLSFSADCQIIINGSEAILVFPIKTRKIWEWHSGGLQYTWHAKITNNQINYEFGFYLFEPMGATPSGNGTFQQLLKEGQFSVWENKSESVSVVEGARVEGTFDQSRQTLSIRLIGAKWVQMLFSQKPKYCICYSYIQGKTRSIKLPIVYK